MSSFEKQEQTGLTVTMRDVARLAGVSPMTVSRALRKNSSISVKTRARVLKVVEEMNYVPDQMAGSLSTKKSGFVALLIPSLNNFHVALTVQALTEGLAETGLQLLLGHTNYSTKTEEAVVESMLRRRPELIILSYDGHSMRTRTLLQDSAIPVIEIWERPANPIEHTVGFSNEEAAYEMTLALIEKGYKNLVFLSEEDDDFTRGSARRAGYVRAMSERALDPDTIFRKGSPPLTIEESARAAAPLLEAYPTVECVFCVSDMAAFGLIGGMVTLGKRVPDDIAVAGFGNFDISRFSSPRISTVVVDPLAIGHQTAQLAKEILARNDEQGQPSERHAVNKCIATSTVFRESTHWLT